MIDPKRWILAEAWLALGLRATWAPRWQEPPAGGWMGERSDLYYAGDGEWRVRRDDPGTRLLGDYDVPSLSTNDLKHELAHYLVASAAERREVNFGISAKPTPDADEAATLAAERVIDAMMRACGRIASMALEGDRAR